MKKLLSIIFTLYIGLLSITQSVEAHVLKTDGNIGAVLHISPQDDPVAGGQSYLFFEFKDKTGNFDPSQCDCKVTVSANNKILHSQFLALDHSDKTVTSSTFSYIFPEKNIYIIEVSGKPRQLNAFQPFILSYDIRVDTVASQPKSQATESSSNGHIIHTLVFFIAFTVFIIWHIIGTLHRSRKKNF